MVDPRRRNRQLALFLVGLLMLNFPMLAMVDRATWPGGLALTPAYLLLVWLLLIGFAALTARQPRS